MIRRQQILPIFFLATVIVAASAEGTSFDAKTDFGTGVTPVGLAAGDLDGDGVLDLVVANATSDSVSILLGSGSGWFGTKTDYVMGAHAVAVAIADFDGDGALDVVTANSNGNSVSVRLGTGDGTLGAKTDYATGNYPSSIAVGDVSGDGRLDLVTANGTPSTASVLLGVGDGTFGAKTDFATGSFPQAVALADFDRDGWLDIVVANYGSTNVSVLFGAGGGAFDAHILYSGGTNPTAIAVGDLNRDGIPDAVTANFSGDDETKAVSVMFGTAAGGFGMGWTDYGAPESPSGIALADVDDDGDLDVLSANYVHNTVSVFLNNGTGVLASRIDLPGGTVPVGVTTGDFDRDGLADIAATNLNGGNVSVFLNSTVRAASGHFAATSTDFPIGTASMTPRTVVLADMNRDGIPDAVTANTAHGSVSVVPGLGGGSFGTSTEYSISPLTNTFPNYVKTADLNRDGYLDFVVTSSKTSLPDVIKTVSVRLSNGAGGFQATWTHLETGSDPQGLDVGDLNRDGLIDLVVANYASASVSVFLATGPGTFGAKTDFPTASFPREVVIGDFNGDGVPDLAAATSGGNRFVSVLLGFGNGTFATYQNYQIPGDFGPMAIATDDVDRDGDLDLVTVGPGLDSKGWAAVLLNDGAATFEDHGRYQTASYPRGLALGDLNGDAIPDLVSANYDGATVSVLHGTGVGSFGSKTDSMIAQNTMSVALGDVNADGNDDIVAAGYSSDALSVLLNTAPEATDLGVSVIATPAIVSVGTAVTYTVAITNHGPGNANGATLVNTFQGLNFVSATPSAGTCNDLSPLTCGLGVLWHDATATVTIVATIAVPGSSISTARILSNMDDTVASNDTAVAVRTAFTDDPLTTGTSIRAVHLTELRGAIDVKRSLAGLPAATYPGESVITPGVTVVKAAHLNTACSALKVAHPSATCSATIPAGQAVGAADFAALRGAIRALE